MNKDFSLLDGTIKISVAELKSSTAALRAFSKPVAQDILLLIEFTEMSVNSIAENLDLPQAVASQHLASLRSANLVHSNRKGRHIFYSINKPNLHAFLECVKLITV